jgi:hypothetical protein
MVIKKNPLITFVSIINLASSEKKFVSINEECSCNNKFEKEIFLIHNYLYY